MAKQFKSHILTSEVFTTQRAMKKMEKVMWVCVYIESTSSKENPKQQNKPTLNALSLCDTSISKSRSFLKGVLDEWSASSQSTDWATSVWSMSMSVSMSCLRGTPGLKIWQHLFYTAVFWLGIISRPHTCNSCVGNKINWTLCQRHFLWCCLTINNFPHLCHSKQSKCWKVFINM